MVSKDQRSERWACRGEGLECLLSLPAVECVVGILQIETDEGASEAFRGGLFDLEPVFSHGSFCLMEVNGRLRGVRGDTTKFLDPVYESQQITALTSRAFIPRMSVALRRLSWFHLKLHDLQVPRSNKTSLSQRSCQTDIETLSPGWSQTWSMAEQLANFSLSKS